MKKMPQFSKIRSRLTFWFLFVSLLTLFSISTVIYYQRVAAIKTEAFRKLTAVRDLKVSRLNNWLEERRGDLIIVSSNLEIRQLSKVFSHKERTEYDRDIINISRNLLRIISDNYRAYNEVFIINSLSGIIEVSTNIASEGLDKSEELFFTGPLKTGEFNITDIYFSKALNKPGMCVSIPIKIVNPGINKIFAILVARIDLENSLYDMLLQRTGMGRTGETLIVNRAAMALNQLRWYNNAPLRLQINAKPAKLASLGEVGIIETEDYRGEKVLAAYTYIPATRWGFVAKQDISEAYLPITKMMRSILILLFVAVIGVYILSYFLAKNIASPVIKMTETAKKIEAGNLLARNNIKRADEFGYLAQTFDSMAESMTSQMIFQQGINTTNEAMVGTANLKDFAGRLIEKLLEVTDSAFGAFHLLNRNNKKFELCFSLGLDPARVKVLDADSPDGEFGKAVTTKKISHLKKIPKDTVFTVNSIAGTALPGSVMTIPITIKNKVTAVISLGSLSDYSKESLQILNQIQTGLATALSNILSAEETTRLAVELADNNQELEAQTEELQALTEELQQQNKELDDQRRQVEEASRLKSEFLSNMSHELRTPLNSVMALSNVLRMQASHKLSTEESGYLEVIERNGRKLLDLINDILDLAKIEAGRMDVAPEMLSLATIIENITDGLLPLAQGKGIELRHAVAADLPKVETDEKRLYHIIQNLVGNAIKFTAKGNIVVSAASDAQKVYVRVVDSGIGIATENLVHIFEEFRQVDGSPSRQYEGTGLGLAISYKAAKLLGGDLYADSRLGEGSTFTLTLPITWQGPVRQSETLTLKAPPELLPGQKSILVVDDNEAAVIQIKAILEQEGYIVNIARDGREAIDFIQHTSPDSIILDLMMPEIDGFDVLKQIRSAKETAAIPVLILTAKDLNPEDFKQLKTNNIQQLVQKGAADREELLLKVKMMLGEKSIIGAGAAQQPQKSATKVRTIAAGAERKKYPGGLPRVLIIEDNPDSMLTIKAILKDKYAILAASDGEQGEQMVLKELPDLVLLDISLSGMDGYSVVSKIKSDEKARHIPVVALTARAMKGDRKKCLEAGCDDYVSKPINSSEILKKLDKWIAKPVEE